LKIAGLDCPKFQDPRFTLGTPDAARQESERQIENTECAIQGFEQAAGTIFCFPFFFHFFQILSDKVLPCKNLQIFLFISRYPYTNLL
jgi:hypothetical protein